MTGRSVPSYRDLPRADLDSFPNAWGVFGVADQLGTLNHLTPERVLNALASVKSGEVINLNLELSAFDPPLIAHRGIPTHTVFGHNEFHRDDRLDDFFLQASTQIDSLRHFGNPEKGFYNGVPGERLVAGTPDLGIQNVAHRGIVGRGLLLDVASYRESIGRPIDQGSSEAIKVEDLDETLKHQGSSVLPGDILMIRTGWLKAALVDESRNFSVLKSPGLEQDESVAEWLWDKNVSLAAADNVALEAWPAHPNKLQTRDEQLGSAHHSRHTGMLHRLLIPLLGLTIGELWNLDDLAIRCWARGSFDCLLTAEPLNLLGGVGSPANALAII